MPVNLELSDCALAGAALTPAFLRDGLTGVLQSLGLLADRVQPGWDSLRQTLRLPFGHTAQRLHRQVTVKLAASLGYGRPAPRDPVTTRDGPEDGGWLMQATGGAALRVWSADHRLDTQSPGTKAFRGSPTRVAQRVLLATGEPAGLLLANDTLRLLLSDPSRADSHITITLTGWRDSVAPPDSYRLLLALASSGTLPSLKLVLQAARLHQAKLTKDLRRQARDAISGFVNALLALHPAAALDAVTLWQEALVLVYRLLFILKLEAPATAGTGFSFAATTLWRTALSPNQALGPLVRRHLDLGADTGRMLEDGLRTLFTHFRDGLTCAELRITPLGGALFGSAAIPLLDRLAWGERAVAILLDRLIWTTTSTGERARLHYGSLDVEDLGGVYEGLLEQQPAIAGDPPRFLLRAGPGRKASGAFYTPHAFVGFLVRETLDPPLAALSPPSDPRPAALLSLKIVDPATGSGHFLVAACRYLGDALLAACRQCDERGLHDRIAALPDPDNSLAAWLPSRTGDGGDGYAEARARAICRRLVAVHCLYGCDRNKLAVELAKLSLWLESYAEGLPLTFLDHRLLHGDALTGPFFDSLATLPVTAEPLDPLLARDVAARLRAGLDRARGLVAELDASIGRDLAELALKRHAKDRLDAELRPLRRLAQAWAGAALTGDRDADDVWLRLAGHVAATAAWPHLLTARQAALLEAGSGAIAWDLAFPEIFPAGFAVVLGNPPWDVVQHNTRDFVAAYDPAVLTAATPAQRTAIEHAVLARPAVAAAYHEYRAGFERLKRIAGRLFHHQRVSLPGHATAGNLDLFRLFAERAMQLAAADGAIGLLLPSAFHANDGATAIRLLYLRQTEIVWCLSFENRRRIFDIDSRFKFDLIVARRPGPTQALRCAFYLDSIEQATDPARVMTYSPAFLQASGGSGLTPLELRGHVDQTIAEALFAHPGQFGAWCRAAGIRLGRDLHMTDDAASFRPAGETGLMLHEGKTIHQYTDRWTTRARYTVDPDSLRPAIAEASRHYRLAFRDIARSNDERTMIACLAPPGVVFGHTVTVEKTPWRRATADALVVCAVLNSFAFDWLVRQKAATHLSLYILDAMPVPHLGVAARGFLAHTALRLSCNHAGFAPLWRQQVGAAPAGPPADRAVPRAAIDAVVAQAYGLDRARYLHVLGSFSHRTDPATADGCLAAFDSLCALGLEAFRRTHDPLADHALVTAMPIPT